jgi:ubiquinone/menaquinone biosynthesis C-methylase UbiE
LLDVGCGNGAAAVHLAATLGLDVVGVDVDPDQIREATLAAPNTPAVRFLVADATDLPFPDDQFNFVYTSKATHHIPDWQQAITEMVRVLRPGGHLVYTDFVAPVGRRFPTRAGINQLASDLALHRVRQRSSPLRYTIILRTAAKAAPETTAIQAGAWRLEATCPRALAAAPRRSAVAFGKAARHQ